MDAYRELIARIGVFFLVTGAFLFILFVSSDIAQDPNFDFLFASMLALGVGWLFRRRKPEAWIGAEHNEAGAEHNGPGIGYFASPRRREDTTAGSRLSRRSVNPARSGRKQR